MVDHRHPRPTTHPAEAYRRAVEHELGPALASTAHLLAHLDPEEIHRYGHELVELLDGWIDAIEALVELTPLTSPRRTEVVELRRPLL